VKQPVSLLRKQTNMTSNILIYQTEDGQTELKTLNMKKFGNSEFSTNPINFYHITKDFIAYFSNVTKNLKDNL